MAGVMDGHIHSGLRPFENAEYAAHLCGHAGPSEALISDVEIQKACEERLEQVIAEVQADTKFEAEAIRNVWCEMMARPWVNALQTAESPAISEQFPQ
jgi:hypothetical protein